VGYSLPGSILRALVMMDTYSNNGDNPINYVVFFEYGILGFIKN
jgi:hypothetical protein